jgi:hypothetical protein
MMQLSARPAEGYKYARPSGGPEWSQLAVILVPAYHEILLWDTDL